MLKNNSNNNKNKNKNKKTPKNLPKNKKPKTKKVYEMSKHCVRFCYELAPLTRDVICCKTFRGGGNILVSFSLTSTLW